MAKSKGFILVWRDIQDHCIWNAEPFTKGQAWLDLIMMANYNNKPFLLGNKVINAEIGTVITSELKLMKRWKWGKEKLRNYLRTLENMDMIEKKADRHMTTICIKNYTTYQTAYQTAEKQVISRDSTEGQTSYQTTNQTTNRPRTDHKPYTMKERINKDNTEKEDMTEDIRHSFGQYDNVYLTDNELSELQKYDVWQKKIDRRSEWKHKNPNKICGADFPIVLEWCIKDQEEQKDAEVKIDHERDKINENFGNYELA